VSVHCLSEEVISFGLGRYRFLVELLKTCVDHNDFEGYEFHHIEPEFDVHLPAWLGVD